MASYVIRLAHSSDQCPTANSKVRERVVVGAAELPKLAEMLGVNIVAGPLAMASEHEAVAIVEAGSIEAVNALVRDSGLMQWNAVRVSFAEPLDDVLRHTETMPPPLY